MDPEAGPRFQLWCPFCCPRRQRIPLSVTVPPVASGVNMEPVYVRREAGSVRHIDVLLAQRVGCGSGCLSGEESGVRLEAMAERCCPGDGIHIDAAEAELLVRYPPVGLQEQQAARMSNAGCKQNAAFCRDRIGRSLCAASSKRAADAWRRSGNAHGLDARFHGRQRAGCKQPGPRLRHCAEECGRAREQRVYKRIIHHGHVFKETAVRQHGRCGALNKVDAQNQRVSHGSSAAVGDAVLVPDLNQAGSSCVIPDDAAAVAKIQPAAVRDGGDELVRLQAGMHRQELELQKRRRISGRCKSIGQHSGCG